MIKNIVVVGGGTAGWTTMSIFLDRIPERTNINLTIIESEDIPTIGVGESTTGQFANLIRYSYYLGDEAEFIRETGSTYKYGIRHSDWHKVGEYFNSPIGGNYVNERRFPSSEYDSIRIHHIANEKQMTSPLQSKAMEQNKLYYFSLDLNHPYQDIFGSDPNAKLHDLNDHAYHLDTFEVGKYLRKKCLQAKRVTRIVDTVTDVIRDDNGFVTKLKLKSDAYVSGDLFVDCTGLAKLLIGDDNEFISYKNNLLLNTAITFPMPYKEHEEIKNYTHAKAMKHGWMWEIPLQHRMGRGYNFSDEYTTADEAKKEVEEYLGYEIDVARVIKYEPGRMKKAWNKNVLSSGLSTAFLEPLEATSIHGTCKQVEHFFENYFSPYLDLKNEYIQKSYNDTIGGFWDDCRDFIVWHYQNTRQDTQFWIDSSSPDRLPEKLKQNMEIWKSRTPRNNDYSNSFSSSHMMLGNTLWYQIAIGMKSLNPMIAKKEMEYYGLNTLTEQNLKAIEEFSEYVMNRAMPAPDYYKLMTSSK